MSVYITAFFSKVYHTLLKNVMPSTKPAPYIYFAMGAQKDEGHFAAFHFVLPSHNYAINLREK